MFLLMLILGAMALALVFALAAIRPRRPGLARWAFAAMLGFALFSPRLALAATGAATQSVDLSAIWQIVLALAGTAVTVGVPVLISATNKRLRLTAGSQAADDLDQALAHGAALALDLLKSVAAQTAP